MKAEYSGYIEIFYPVSMSLLMFEFELQVLSIKLLNNEKGFSVQLLIETVRAKEKVVYSYCKNSML